MVQINNLFSGLMAFIVSWGLIYLMHPTILSFTAQLPSEVHVFALVILLGLEMLIGLAFPYLIIVSNTD